MYENQLMQLQQQTWNMEQAAMTTENLKNTVCFNNDYRSPLATSCRESARELTADGDGGCYEDRQ